MRKRVRNEPDSGPASEGAVITYSRLPRGGRGPVEREEPYLEAREVPYRDDDIRAYDPERAAVGLDDAIDAVDKPRRRRGGFGAVLVGTLALAAGMVILAYAYGVATRVDEPATLSAGASATAPESTDATRGTLPADDAARSIPVTGEAPAAALAPAPEASGSGGAPMDGDFAEPSGGAAPALVAPVPATVTPAAPAKPAPAEAAARPPAAKAASVKPASVNPADTKPASAKPADGSDDLIANIERLLKRDAATAAASGQPAGGSAASAGPTPLVPAAGEATGANALPPLPDANTVANGPRQPPGRLVPPADIPNVTPSDAGLGGLH